MQEHTELSSHSQVGNSKVKRIEAKLSGHSADNVVDPKYNCFLCKDIYFHCRLLLNIRIQIGHRTK